jgi:excisionase family DNA binding protein
MKTYTTHSPVASPTSLRLMSEEIDALFADADWATKFPPILTVSQAAELLQVPVRTIYDWSSRGLLKHCSRRVGRHLRFVRTRLVESAFNKGLTHEKT